MNNKNIKNTIEELDVFQHTIKNICLYANEKSIVDLPYTMDDIVLMLQDLSKWLPEYVAGLSCKLHMYGLIATGCFAIGGNVHQNKNYFVDIRINIYPNNNIKFYEFANYKHDDYYVIMPAYHYDRTFLNVKSVEDKKIILDRIFKKDYSL